MKKIFILMCLIFSISAQAAEEKKVCSVDVSADEQMECLFNNWKIETSKKMQEQCKKQGIDLMDDSCIFENVFVWAEESLSVLPNDPKWFDARIIAYDHAATKARAEIAKSLKRKLDLEKLTTLVDDQNLLTDEDLKEAKNQKDPNVYNRIWDKSLKVVESKLDSKLKEFGVAPTEYSNVSVEVKKDLLRNSIEKTSTLTALEETMGMIPVHSFEVVDKKGETIIRVVVSKSMERISHIKAFLRDGNNVLPNPNKKSDKSIIDQIIFPSEEMMKYHSVRWLYDQEGYPVIVSYGQATYQESDNLIVKKMRKEAAFKRANQIASEEINKLLDLTTSVKSTLKEIAEEYQRQEKTDTFDKIKSDASFNHSLNDMIKEYSSASLEGDVKIHQWLYKHPHPHFKGHYIVGVVRMLSPKTIKSAQKIKNIKAAPRTPVVNNAKPVASGKESAPQTQEVQSLESFAGVYIPRELDDYDF